MHVWFWRRDSQYALHWTSTALCQFWHASYYASLLSDNFIIVFFHLIESIEPWFSLLLPSTYFSTHYYFLSHLFTFSFYPRKPHFLFLDPKRKKYCNLSMQCKATSWRLWIFIACHYCRIIVGYKLIENPTRFVTYRVSFDSQSMWFVKTYAEQSIKDPTKH